MSDFRDAARELLPGVSDASFAEIYPRLEEIRDNILSVPQYHLVLHLDNPANPTPSDERKLARQADNLYKAELGLPV